MTLGWVVSCGLAVLSLALAGKIFLLQRGIDEVSRQFGERLQEDGNGLLYVSGRDRHLRGLASGINESLTVLRKKQLEYQNGNRELKEAVTNISHDLRTPLTAICGYLELLGTEEKSGNVERYLNLIKNRTDAMKELTEELFRYSVIVSTQTLKEGKREKTGSGKAEGRRWADGQAVSVNRLLEECLLSYYNILRQRGITPFVVLPERAVYWQAEETSLKRILENIMSNILKYSDGDIKAELSDAGYLTFCNPADGLDAVSVQRLFDRFYTVETGRDSTGLGLSIARTLTEKEGGTITAGYAAGILTITIWFPAICAPIP